MPSTLSKDEKPEDEDSSAKKRRALPLLHLTFFQSVIQHVITLQSEPMIVRSLCNDDAAVALRLLGNTSGLVGLVGILFNQVGGKVSDAIGRRPGFFLGPLGNMFLGVIVFNNPNCLRTVLVCRVIRMVITTFSNTVIGMAALNDICTGKEFAVSLSHVMANIGVGVIVAPILESVILKRTKTPRSAYAALSVLGMIQAIFVALLMPETLEKTKRVSVRAAISLSGMNPFRFVKVYTDGSPTLQKLVTLTTMQMFLEGKNLSDTGNTVQSKHLKWGVNEIRNFLVAVGVLAFASGAGLTPYLLKKISARGFTTLTNVLNALGFFLRGASFNPKLYMLSTLPTLPGGNGASANAMKGLAAELATAQGFGKGEFSAWVNNLRALAGAAAPVLYGNFYNFCVKRGIMPGRVFWLIGVLGAVVPEVILRSMKDSELSPPSSQKVEEVEMAEKPVSR